MENIQDYQYLFPYAYHILGSVDEAKDIVQDVIEKRLGISGEQITNEKNYLIKSVINTSINVKNRNKKTLKGEVWLPEPVSTESADAGIHRTEIISYSMMVLLEHLTPKERAVFILKEAFDYAHEEVAMALDLTPENSRKLFSRAKDKLNAARQRKKISLLNKSANPDLKNYIHAIKNGDALSLVELLSQDIAFTADSGGKVKIVRELTEGVEAVMELLFYLYDTYQKDFVVEHTFLNHQHALLYYKEGKLINCQVLELDESAGKITNIYSVVDPDKLRSIHNRGERL